MKNTLTICLFLASALITLAQPTQKKSNIDLAGDPYYAKDSILVPIHSSMDDDEPAEVDFVSLYVSVRDQKTKFPMDAKIIVFYDTDFADGDLGTVVKGEFNTDLKNFGLYFISILAPGYFETTDTVWVLSESRKRINKNLYLVPIEVGANRIMNNIQFNIGKTSLAEESFAELDKEALFLNQNPDVIFEIAGHTDSDGPLAFNLLLSQGRAKTVVEYLVSKGVEPSQLMARGYGEARPMEGNETHIRRANNRRVEFTVVAMRRPLEE